MNPKHPNVDATGVTLPEEPEEPPTVLAPPPMEALQLAARGGAAQRIDRELESEPPTRLRPNTIADPRTVIAPPDPALLAELERRESAKRVPATSARKERPSTPPHFLSDVRTDVPPPPALGGIRTSSTPRFSAGMQPNPAPLRHHPLQTAAVARTLEAPEIDSPRTEVSPIVAIGEGKVSVPKFARDEGTPAFGGRAAGLSVKRLGHNEDAKTPPRSRSSRELKLPSVSVPGLDGLRSVRTRKPGDVAKPKRDQSERTHPSRHRTNRTKLRRFLRRHGVTPARGALLGVCALLLIWISVFGVIRAPQTTKSSYPAATGPANTAEHATANAPSPAPKRAPTTKAAAFPVTPKPITEVIASASQSEQSPRKPENLPHGAAVAHLVAGRYVEARAVYQKLAAAHPEHREYAEIARILAHKIEAEEGRTP